jgi:hypothetical protein
MIWRRLQRSAKDMHRKVAMVYPSVERGVQCLGLAYDVDWSQDSAPPYHRMCHFPVNEIRCLSTARSCHLTFVSCHLTFLNVRMSTQQCLVAAVASPSLPPLAGIQSSSQHAVCR